MFTCGCKGTAHDPACWSRRQANSTVPTAFVIGGIARCPCSPRNDWPCDAIREADRADELQRRLEAMQESRDGYAIRTDAAEAALVKSVGLEAAGMVLDAYEQRDKAEAALAECREAVIGPIRHTDAPGIECWCSGCNNKARYLAARADAKALAEALGPLVIWAVRTGHGDEAIVREADAALAAHRDLVMGGAGRCRADRRRKEATK
jgi:hypothetical protein